MPTEPLELKDIGDVTLARFVAGRILDDALIQAALEQLSILVAERGRRKLVLSFHNIEYMSSGALGKLINLQRTLTHLRGRIMLRDLNPQIYEVFEITKLNKVFFIGPDDPDELNKVFFIGPDDPDEESGVGARFIPPKPSGGAAVILPSPPESDD